MGHFYDRLERLVDASDAGTRSTIGDRSLPRIRDMGVAQCDQANRYSGSGTTHGALFLLQKEFLPLLLAAAVWGSMWREKRIKFKCDNSTVVSAL